MDDVWTGAQRCEEGIRAKGILLIERRGEGGLLPLLLLLLWEKGTTKDGPISRLSGLGS